MDISAQEAIDALRPLLKQAQAAQKIGGILEKLVSMENHQVELAASIVRLTTAEADLRDEITVATGRARTIVVDAEQRANQIVAAAQDVAGQKIEFADAEAAVTLARLADEKLQAEAGLGNLAAQRDDLLLDVEVQIGKRDALIAEIEALKARLSPLVG